VALLDQLTSSLVGANDMIDRPDHAKKVDEALLYIQQVPEYV
jgi:hypothetical protein